MSEIKYLVGYGKPPEATQFKKGQSGNPSGRPKTSVAEKKRAAAKTRFADIVLEETNRSITLMENGGPVEMSMIQAVIRRMGVDAVKGNQKAQLAVVSLAHQAHEASLKELEERIAVVGEYISRCEQEIAYCKRHSLPPPELIPHPDDINVDLSTGDVQFVGPMTAKEKAEWNNAHQRKKEGLEEVQYLRKQIEECPERRERYGVELASEMKIVRLIDAFFPEEKVRRKAGFDREDWVEQTLGKDYLAELQKKRRRAE
ncbi:MAG: hypothetical protein GC152_14925 [Alphaproteobacteria bacterium]|nr:hypothetical protein [Alphaproteobacteria bacterium]